MLETTGVFPTLEVVVGHVQVVLSLHALAIVLGVGAGAILAMRRAPDPATALMAVAIVAVTALAGAHGLFVLLHGTGGGGLASTGGIAAGLVATWLIARLAREPAATLLDAIVPAGLLALAIGRVGCFLAGCCYGRPTALPWGTVFPGVGAPARHPLQLYSAAADLAIVLLLPARAAAPGTIAARGCVAFGLVRAALELLRDPATTDVLPFGGMTLPQAAALALAAGGAALLPRLRRRGPFDYASRTEDRRVWPMRSR